MCHRGRGGIKTSAPADSGGDDDESAGDGKKDGMTPSEPKKPESGKHEKGDKDDDD
jgi:hypothetical protein